MERLRSSATLAFIGFVAVGFAYATNTIVARANAGEVPAFSLAFFRWTIVAADRSMRQGSRRPRSISG
jgi:GH24 family phage-related lysozyme (muramidase)